MEDFLLFVAVGFAAQLIDGAIGMAYGLLSTSILLSLGITPAVASASVHTAEIFTTGASGLAHWRFGNVNWSVVKRLAIPGMVGGFIGAYILSSIDAQTVRPIVAIYLATMGIWILVKAVRHKQLAEMQPRYVQPLGFVGGFLDAIGGGGWGPIVASTMLGQGTQARKTVGSTNAAEFFVTSTISFTFLGTIGLELWPIILGLIVGGVLAAPIAAYTVGKLPDRLVMTVVALVICGIAAIQIFRELIAK
jgi:uncharacterized membrane protein YfcA